jgi:hypothetical protein
VTSQWEKKSLIQNLFNFFFSFFLDKPLMQWLDASNAKSLEKLKEKESATTLRSSSEKSPTEEQSMESLSETMDNTREGEISGGVLDTAAEETDDLQSKTEESLDTTSGVLRDKTQQDLQDKGELQSSPEGINLGDKCVTSIDDSSTKTGSLEHLDDRNFEEHGNSTEMNSSICNDDMILSSSENPGLPDDHLASPVEQLTNTQSSVQMNSTPKLAPYQDVGGENVIELDKEGYREGISRDSGIHESKEDVEDEDTEEHQWTHEQDSGELRAKDSFLRVHFLFVFQVTKCVLVTLQHCFSLQRRR